MKEVGITADIAETGNTFHENAFIKAQYIYNLKNKSVLADDSGLEVTALNNEPGVYSSRYAGEPSDSIKNTDKLLNKLKGIAERSARFVTVLCYVSPNGVVYFEGSVEGNITTEKRGTNGFGYDPVFIPNGFDRTFAEMTFSEKNKISHRAKALKKFGLFLETQQQV